MLRNNVKEGILETIGNTPLVNFKNIYAEFPFDLYGKLEMFNPSGSIKDRTSYRILTEALQQGLIHSDSVIIESTSGNMGLGLAQICLYYGLKLILVVDPHINKESEQLLSVYGAELVKVQEKDENGGYLKTRLAKVQELLALYPMSFNPNQYQNIHNPLAHRTTVNEILQQLGYAPDYIFIPTSTCGTLMGFAFEIQRLNLNTKIIAVDAEGSVLFDQKPKKRLIPGMGASTQSHFLDERIIHDVVHISDMEAVEYCHKLLHLESVLTGGSSGAVIAAINKYAQHIAEGSQVIALLPDRGERYLQTVYNKKWVESSFKNQLKIEELCFGR